jgi:hypothetical protein
MHECPNCQMACDCDGEDTWNDAAAGACYCPCVYAEVEDDDEPCPDCGSLGCDGRCCLTCQRPSGACICEDYDEP